MPQATLTVGARGSNVAQLHNAMLQLGIQLPDSEIRRTFFGPATRQAVQQIQQAHGLPVSGEFDEGTAAAMTARLVARDPQAPPPATTAAAGHGGGGSSGRPVAQGQPPRSPGRPAASPFTWLDAAAGSTTPGQRSSRSHQARRISHLRDPLPQPPPPGASRSPPTRYPVPSRVPTSAAVGGLCVQLVDRNAGDDAPLGDTTTDPNGRYQLTLQIPDETLRERRKTHPDLQARALAARALAASDVRYDASAMETLDVTLPAGERDSLASTRPSTGALGPSFRALWPTSGKDLSARTSPTWPTNRDGTGGRWPWPAWRPSSARPPRHHRDLILTRSRAGAAPRERPIRPAMNSRP